MFYFYLNYIGEGLLTAALSSYKWDIGYPFWGGTKAKLEKLLEGNSSDRDSNGSLNGEEQESAMVRTLQLTILYSTSRNTLSVFQKEDIDVLDNACPESVIFGNIIYVLTR